MNKKILINVPNLSLPGGVANHYLGLFHFWRENVVYNIVGRRKWWFPAILSMMYDCVKFVLLCIFGNFDVVVLNPSLANRALHRDAIFLTIAKVLRLKVCVFIHGWDVSVERKIDANHALFLHKFGRADAFIVLAAQFEGKLRSWGIRAPIYLSTTKVDDRLIEGFDIHAKRYSKNLLFLARMEPNKGIMIALEAFRRIIENHPEARFIVAGSGSALDAAIEFVSAESIQNVEFLGNISGHNLIDTFIKSDVYILPSSHGEGMPTSVLEAMAFGLPVITRPVGGLVDFFEDGKMGLISDSLDPEWFSLAIDRLFSSPKFVEAIGHYNHEYAKQHFLASRVAKQLEGILKGI
jgi:glycosyltransferase involved in cell wall biosynthesis